VVPAPGGTSLATVSRVYSGPAEIQKVYQDDRVAREYVARRFESPLGALLHRRQVRAVQRLIRDQAIEHAAELAPGPARLTVAIAPLVKSVTLIDASAEMLTEARRRLDDRGIGRRARFLRADAFRLPLAGGRFNLLYSFRLIRHFERADRVRLYHEIARVLAPRGWLVFDAVNRVVSEPVRARARAGEYEHFDALLQPDELHEELRDAGFDVVSLAGVERRFSALMMCQVYVAPRSRTLARGAMELLDRLGGPPLEWIVTCRRA
jgi:SAM-dependent methyltransferase